MAEGISSRITRLNQLLIGKTPGKKVPQLDKDTLLDAFVALYHECNTDHMCKDKNIGTYVQKFKPLIGEIEKLRCKKSDFEIRKTIGRGHFGEVHVVREKVTGDVYAMKVLKKSETLSQDNTAFFEEERDIMAFANNPWITSLQYAFQDYESLYFVMDFHPGGDLLSLLAKYDNIFEEEIARFYLGEMVMAIHAVHVLGYVHRDIKPENVLLDRTGHIKLADFGSSARLSSTKMVNSKMPVGTPEYIAPEVLMSMDGSAAGKYGIECDWWSLGVVAYEMMVGNTPFEADSVVVVYSKIMDFKNSLKFSDDEPLSDDAKNLCRNLLTDRNSRMGFEDLAKHPFFVGLDWTTLSNAVPPYVPTLHSVDDTSNFDDFETQQSGPRLQDFMGKKTGFQGKDLPFIGFTFTRQLTMASLNEGNEGSKDHMQKRESLRTIETKDSQVVSLRIDLQKEQKRCAELKAELDEKIQQLNRVDNERVLLESQKSLLGSELKDLEHNLDQERSNRAKAEAEALRLLKELQEVSRRAGELRDSELTQALEEQKQIVVQLEQERFTSNKRAQHLERQLQEHKDLLEESSTRVADLQAKLSKVNEDTKSNVSELQQKLLKVTEDNETRIRLFQEKLAKAVSSVQEAADQLSKLEREKDDLQRELALLKSREEESKQQRAQEDALLIESRSGLTLEIKSRDERICQLLNDKKLLTAELSEAHEKYDGLVEYGKKLRLDVEEKMDKIQKELLTASRDVKRLEEESRKLREDQEEKSALLNAKDISIETLKATVNKLEQDIQVLNGDRKMNVKHGEEKVFGDRLQLTRQISQAQQEKINLENEIALLRVELGKERHVSALLKKRIEDSDVEHEQTVDNFESSIAKLNRDLTQAADENKRYQKEAATSKAAVESLNLLVSQLQVDLEGKKAVAQEAAKLKDVELQLEHTKKLLADEKNNCKGLDDRLQLAKEEVQRAIQDKDKLHEELLEKTRHAGSQDLTILMLKQTCSMLEGQVEELEIMNDEYQDREAQFNSLKRQHYQQQEKMEQQLSEALTSLEQQRQLRLKLEEKLRVMEDAAAISNNDLVTRIHELESSLRSESEKVGYLNSQLSESERANKLQDVNIKNLQRKTAFDSDEIAKLQAEVTALNELVASQKASNFSMATEIENLAEKLEDLQIEKGSLENQIERTFLAHAEEKIKIESTLAQQTKLIDFLQQKVTIDGEKGRKKFKSTKANEAPSPVDARKLKDLEKALEKEKHASLQLHLQLTKARDEIQQLRAELHQFKQLARSTSSVSAPSTPLMAHKNELKNKVTSSPSTSIADIYNQTQRALQNGTPTAGLDHVDAVLETPHSLQAALNMRSSKCSVCLSNTLFAKQVFRCADCPVVVHEKCAPSLPSTCGTSSDASAVATIAAKMEGWLRCPRKGGKQGLDQKWVVLEDFTLSIYDNQNAVEFEPAETTSMTFTDGELIVHSGVLSSELATASSADLPYVFALELLPNTSANWPRRIMCFAAPTFSDKARWVAVLEQVAEHQRVALAKQEDLNIGDVLLELSGKNQLDINCAVMLSEEDSVLGAEEGLFVSRLKVGSSARPVQVIGVGNVYQLEMIGELSMVVLIAGKERLLCSIDVKDLENRVRQMKMGAAISALSAHQIEKVKSCHLFTVRKIDRDFYACAASGHKIVVLKYNPSVQGFSVKKEVEANEACTCLLFTPSTVIFGTNRFYNVDLKHFQKRDFLDASDTSLAFAVYGSSQTHSEPVAVFDVSHGRPREEYLLCFTEFGVFVDWQGRRSRKGDLKWKRLPLGFAYMEPYLYVTHFKSVAVYEVPNDVKAEATLMVPSFVDMVCPRFLGSGFSSGSVLLASMQLDKVDLIAYRGLRSGSVGSRSALPPLPLSSATASNPLVDHSGVGYIAELLKSPSSHSICSDEETSMSIGQQQQTTPDAHRRAEQIRTADKEKNRMSFKMPFSFKGSSKRSSQFDGAH